MPKKKRPFAADDAVVQALVRGKARRPSRAPGFRTQVAEDLAQALFAGLLQRLAGLNLDREHGLAVAASAIDQLGANLLRDRLALKRDDRRVQSLSALAPGGPGEGFVELADAVTQSNLDARTGGGGGEDRASLRVDLAAVLDGLPPDLRTVAERLTRQSVAEAARDLATPRTTFYESVRRLRRRFERAGLKEYLPKLPSGRARSG